MFHEVRDRYKQHHYTKESEAQIIRDQQAYGNTGAPATYNGAASTYVNGTNGAATHVNGVANTNDYAN